MGTVVPVFYLYIKSDVRLACGMPVPGEVDGVRVLIKKP